MLRYFLSGRGAPSELFRADRIGLPMGHRNFPPRLGLVSRGAPVNPVEDVRDLGEALGLRIEPGVGCQPVHPVDR
jgi:hypothetical protein